MSEHHHHHHHHHHRNFFQRKRDELKDWWEYITEPAPLRPEDKSHHHHHRNFFQRKRDELKDWWEYVTEPAPLRPEDKSHHHRHRNFFQRKRDELKDWWEYVTEPAPERPEDKKHKHERSFWQRQKDGFKEWREDTAYWMKDVVASPVEAWKHWKRDTRHRWRYFREDLADAFEDVTLLSVLKPLAAGILAMSVGIVAMLGLGILTNYLVYFVAPFLAYFIAAVMARFGRYNSVITGINALLLSSVAIFISDVLINMWVVNIYLRENNIADYSYVEVYLHFSTFIAYISYTFQRFTILDILATILALYIAFAVGYKRNEAAKL